MPLLLLPEWKKGFVHYYEAAPQEQGLAGGAHGQGRRARLN
jgi:hypothetical protein